MAKKSVAKLQDKTGKNYTKIIRSMKSPKTGAYIFKEQIIHNDGLKDLLKK